jgi:glutamine---fructose-6-phosphate transaminase (isomerizing)
MPVALAAPSLQTLYGVEPRVEGWLAIAISQSGRTPEIATVLGRFAAAGARTIAITNDPASPLASAASAHVALDAGPERAVPATKTFTAELAAMALIAEALAASAPAASPPAAPSSAAPPRGASSSADGSGAAVFGDAHWARVPDAVAEVLADDSAAERAAAALGGAQELVCVARGFLVCVALEAALKLREAAGVRAEGWSSADFRHGPVTVASPDLPLLAISTDGPAAADVAELAQRVESRGARVLRLSDAAGADLSIPGGLPEPLQAIPASVRAQQLALAVARRRGLDPDRPPGLDKVTPTT